jgi:uncharacterized protein
MLNESVVEAVQHYLHVLKNNGVPVRFGIVFGSQSTGKADEWSDIDLLVVSPRFDEQYRRQDIDLLWKLAAHSDSRIEPIPCGEQQWREDDASAIIEIARRQGERVVPAA